MKNAMRFFIPIFLSGVVVFSLIYLHSGRKVAAVSLNESEVSAHREAMFYEKMDDNKVWCRLCPRKCIIPEGKRGFCRVRENRGGKLYSLVYGKPCSISVEPIEKAPFYHFKPGHRRLCIATVSCNLRCKYCQNSHISQVGPGEVDTYNLSPFDVVKIAQKEKVESICFTFNEPVVFYEYVYDIAKLAKQKGIKSSIVSAGYINEKPLRKLVKVLDAIKIDLKAYNEDFYRRICSAELGPVLKTLKILKEEGKHFEIVNLIVPTLNDDPEEIKKMCLWIKENLGDSVPLHFLRFHPSYRLTNLPSTNISKLETAIRIAKQAGLKYVYIGNVPGHRYNSTYCPNCGKMLIQRAGLKITENNIENGKCKHCGAEIAGVWD